jgi:hypothetical protein
MVSLSPNKFFAAIFFFAQKMIFPHQASALVFYATNPRQKKVRHV